MQPIDTTGRERADDRADTAFSTDTAVADAPRTDAPFALTPPHNPGQMRVTKRSGRQEVVDVNKIVRAVGRCCEGLTQVDPMRVATRTISGLYDGATTRELDQLSIQTAAALTAEEPEYSRLAARLLATYIDKEVAGQEIHSFSQSAAETFSATEWSMSGMVGTATW